MNKNLKKTPRRKTETQRNDKNIENKKTYLSVFILRTFVKQPVIS